MTKKKSRLVWTDEKLKEMQRLRDLDVPVKKIAEILGTSKETIYVYSRRNKETNYTKEKNGIPIKVLQNRFKEGDKVICTYSEHGNKIREEETTGKIIKMYQHHALVLLDNGFKESFLFFDLKKANQKGETKWKAQ